jgi:hypothetical protein
MFPGFPACPSEDDINNIKKNEFLLQREHTVSQITETSQLMIFRGIIAFCCENCVKHISTLCAQSFLC